MSITYDIFHGLISKFMPLFPIGAVFSVTSRCIAKCQMCNIWQHQAKDLPIEYFLNLVESPVFSRLGSVAFTGGEPTLRNDLDQLLSKLIHRSTRLSGVNITTNALLPEKLETTVDSFIQTRNRLKKDIKILIQVSLDGPPSIHDQIRGVPGAYDKVMQSVERLNKLCEKNENCEYYFLCVLLPINLPILREIDELFSSLNRRVVYNLLSDASYLLPDGSNPKFTHNEELSVADFLKKKVNESKDALLNIHYKQLIAWLESGARRNPCGVTDQHIIISNDGAILPCLNYTDFRIEGIAEPGDLLKYWRSSQRSKLRKQIRRNVCPHCRSFCGPNTFDAALSILQLNLARRFPAIKNK